MQLRLQNLTERIKTDFHSITPITNRNEVNKNFRQKHNSTQKVFF